MKLPKLVKVDPNAPTKKKILLLADDCRLKSGVGTVSYELIKQTCHKYDWVQLGGALKHPDHGKPPYDASLDFRKESGCQHANVKIYAVDGYGNEEILRGLLENEKPDMIIHFTDPRFWGWLYAMEHEIRQHIPLGYLNIWDDLPFPHWNEPFYESCDLLMAISKQTYNINKHVCQRTPRVEGKDLFYVQHGIDENKYFPLEEGDVEYNKVRENLLKGHEYDFIAFFNSRNIRRKGVSDLLLAYKKMCQMLTPEQAGRCLLFLHTDPVDNNGTDLPACYENMANECNVGFSSGKVDSKVLNYMYNMADVTCNPSSAEGFGLSHMESMMAGTPTIATVLGGLQDQMGFQVYGEEFNVKHLTDKVPSNSTGELSTEHGEWTLPLWPQLNLQGSPTTPYIYDSRPSIPQIANQLKVWYDLGREERKRRGLVGRKWAIKNNFTAKGMAEAFETAVDTCFEEFKPREKVYFTNITKEVKPTYPIGEII